MDSGRGEGEGEREREGEWEREVGVGGERGRSISRAGGQIDDGGTGGQKSKTEVMFTLDALPGDLPQLALSCNDSFVFASQFNCSFTPATTIYAAALAIYTSGVNPLPKISQHLCGKCPK